MKKKAERLMMKSFKSFSNVENAVAKVESSNEFCPSIIKSTHGLFIQISDNQAMFISIGCINNDYANRDNETIYINEYFGFSKYYGFPYVETFNKYKVKVKEVVVPSNYVDMNDLKHIGWYKCHILDILEIEKCEFDNQNFSN